MTVTSDAEVEVRTGNLFDSEAQTLVNTVNCVGVMGKGIALEFKRRFPAMFEDYAARCARREVELGRPYLYRPSHGPWVLNFPTKDHWRSVSRLSDIEAGLEFLAKHARTWGIESLAVPPLGCGQGGLDWKAVGPTLHRHLSRLGIPVILYAPHGTPAEQLAVGHLAGRSSSEPMPAPAIPAGALALVELLRRIVERPHHWPVGRTRFQKLAYFATAAGIPTGLEFERGSYGPYSSQLKALQTRLANNGLLVEDQTGRMLRVEPGPAFAAARGAWEAEFARWSPTLDRIVDLFLRLDTERTEIAASVHRVAAEVAGRGETASERDVLEEVLRWKAQRRSPLDPEAVARATRSLNLLGWIDVAISQDLPGLSEVDLVA